MLVKRNIMLSDYLSYCTTFFNINVFHTLKSTSDQAFKKPLLILDYYPKICQDALHYCQEHQCCLPSVHNRYPPLYVVCQDFFKVLLRVCDWVIQAILENVGSNFQQTFLIPSLPARIYKAV